MRSDNHYRSSWHGTRKLDDGEILMNQSIHMIDLLQYLMRTVRSLRAYTATLGHSIWIEDSATAVLHFENNSLGLIYSFTASSPGNFRKLEITGTKGTAIMVENSFKVWQFADQIEADTRAQHGFGMIERSGGIFDPTAFYFKLMYGILILFYNLLKQIPLLRLIGKPNLSDTLGE